MLTAIILTILIKYAFSLKTLTYIVCVVMIITAVKYILDAKNDPENV